jgi:hypothetical protein
LGWPSAEHPPGSDGFEPSAVAWLLDVLPARYREPVRARRYPVGLAAIARHHTEPAVDDARQGYRVIRTELAGQPLHEIDAVLTAYRVEGAKLAAAARAAVLKRKL